MRIGGLASGIDTESIIKDLMKAEKIPLDKVTQKKQYFEWQLNDYRTANRDLKDFSTKLFDNMILSKNFNAKNVTVSDPNAVSINAKGNTENFSGTIEVKELAKNATLQSDKDNKILEKKPSSTKLSDLNASENDWSISISAPGSEETVNLTFTKDKTIGDVLKEINEKTGVRAFYDENTGRIGVSAKESGTKNAGVGKDIVISGTFADTVGLSGVDAINGANAEFTYNGLTLTRSSNTFELDGMEITLKAKTDKPVTFNATTDTDKVFDNIKGFVDDYNKMIEDLNKKIREPKYRNYQPLSTEQKADMKENEIKLWEEKAMSGTLRNNPEITSMLSAMRTALSAEVKTGNGEKISLSQIGITTSKNYLDHGKLVIDETKLKEAITKNPQDIQKLFGQDVKEGETDKTAGIARLLRKEVDATQGVIQKKAGKIGDSNKAFTLGRTLDDMNKQIDRFQDKMKMVESRYWKQFNAMENAIQRANAQSANLMNALGGGA
ncbi:flagellar hook-associated protein 2 [Sporosarcina sp. NCCP-2716]|uniref:flagellar hook-associated protein 2 n=1 Tax=Sporosarcina sp. NCCP-2716 TaxID=2943679 RepID=UPI00203C719F|nr:flagellar hook-associated protein 2 [Sporosarcina sp. NCCP-2716]GKV67532.1 flagellar hook-associated protein 2 [Sporosarcina sp. NCCP-2716]